MINKRELILILIKQLVILNKINEIELKKQKIENLNTNSNKKIIKSKKILFFIIEDIGEKEIDYGDSKKKNLQLK